MLFGQMFDAESSTYTYLLAGSSMSLRVWRVVRVADARRFGACPRGATRGRDNEGDAARRRGRDAGR